MYPYFFAIYPLLLFELYILHYKSMKLKFIVLALLPLTFAACQSSDIQRAGDLAMATIQQKNADQILPAYYLRHLI